jgi:D-glycero-D-manno-heptose 1,7-bisphosphate phosphatase
MSKQKCVFLDRDGVLNLERGDYTYTVADFEVLPGVPETLKLLKQQGFILIVVTNQGGIAKGLYTKNDVLSCHHKLQEQCDYLIDALYYAPSHPAHSESLSRKPDSLMLERAIARFNIEPAASWLVGDSKRDLQAAEKVGINAILVGDQYPESSYLRKAHDLVEAAAIILKDIKKPA